MVETIVRLTCLKNLLSRKYELSIIFVDRKKIIEINEQYLNHEGATDVITFNYLSGKKLKIEEDVKVIGEIFVCIEVAVEVAASLGNSISKELILYIVHGVLHLCGFDDHTDIDRKIMRKQEQRIMSNLATRFDSECFYLQKY